MTFEFRPSFDRAVRSLKDEGRKGRIRSSVAELVRCLENRSPVPTGLGLKRMRGPYWEIRASVRDRILVRWERDSIEFILAGSHDDIHRFLRAV